jgi:hypothetical protein
MTSQYLATLIDLPAALAVINLDDAAKKSPAYAPHGSGGMDPSAACPFRVHEKPLST